MRFWGISDTIPIIGMLMMVSAHTLKQNIVDSDFGYSWGGNRMSGAQDPHYIEFATRLRAARKARRLSQKEFGELVNQRQSFISKVETCERRLDIIEACAWCIALGIRLDDVLPPSLKKALDDAAGQQR